MPSPIFQADLPISIKFSGRNEPFAEQQHYHNTYEISIQLDGSRTLLLNEKKYSITAGKAFIIRPYVVHGQEESDTYSESFSLNFSGEALSDVIERLNLRSIPDKLTTCIIDLNTEQLETMRLYFSQIELYYSENEDTSKKFMIMSLLLLLNLTAGLIDSCPAVMPFERRAAKESAIFTALDYINAHSNRNITLSEVSGYIHMSKSNLCRIFKKATGVTFNRYLCGVRAESVKRLLLNTDLPLKEIARRTGFESADYMSKTFKRVFGISPAKFKADKTKVK